jgi:hypothetical protein
MVGALPADPELPLKIGGGCSGLALRTGKITHADKFTGFVRKRQVQNGDDHCLSQKCIIIAL